MYCTWTFFLETDFGPVSQSKQNQQPYGIIPEFIQAIETKGKQMIETNNNIMKNLVTSLETAINKLEQPENILSKNSKDFDNSDGVRNISENGIKALDSNATNEDDIIATRINLPILSNITEVASDLSLHKVAAGIVGKKVSNGVITMAVNHAIDSAAEHVKKQLAFHIDFLAGIIKKVAFFFLLRQ